MYYTLNIPEKGGRKPGDDSDWLKMAADGWRRLARV